jgi:head-tail adaptor
MTIRALTDSRMMEQLADFFPQTCTIQTLTETKNSVGDVIFTPVDYPAHIDLACRITAAGGSENRRPNMTYSIDNFIVLLRDYYDTITNKMRVKNGSTYYNILLVEHDAQNEMTRLTVEIVK